MLKNYFKIAFRNLMKYKFISFINLFGLTIGLTCCLLILSYILNEVSYDNFKSSKNIYRVERTFLKPLLAAVIAFVTISIQALKAATSNPVKSLRTE